MYHLFRYHLVAFSALPCCVTTHLQHPFIITNSVSTKQQLPISSSLQPLETTFYLVFSFVFLATPHGMRGLSSLRVRSLLSTVEAQSLNP